MKEYMQTQGNYKDVWVHSLAHTSPAEPFNATISTANLSSSCNPEGCSTLTGEAAIGRIPVVSASGQPLMPCKPSKARKLMQEGKAIGKWSKLGIFYIQLTFDPASIPNQHQRVVLGLDPGSKFDGIAVVSKKSVLQTGMLELPKGIAKKMEQRRRMRRFRRYRKTRRRPCRFNNRKRKEGWIAPSQKAKVDFRLKIIEELRKLYPITDYIVEDVRFNHYRKRWGKYFSTAEIGKKKLYEKLSDSGILHTIEGHETAKLREEYGLKKVSDKRKRVFSSHAVDALVIAAKIIGLKDFSVPSFFVWKRYQNARRQLHRLEPRKGGVRARYGGSDSLPPFKKNDVVLYRGRLARVGGFMGNRISLHQYDLDNKRFTKYANPKECIRLFNQRIMYEEKRGRSANPLWASVRVSYTILMDGSVASILQKTKQTK